MQHEFTKISDDYSLYNVIQSKAQVYKNNFEKKNNLYNYNFCGALTRFRAMASTYEASSSHSLVTQQSVGLLWMSDQS
jgi:hypothetical protein